MFAVPPRKPPRASDLTFSDAAWGRPSLLQGADTTRYLYVSLALQRMRHLFFPSVRGAEVIGTLGEAQPLVASATSSAWLRKAPDPAAQAEWRALVARDAAAAKSFQLELRAIDRGDGKMREWAAALIAIKDWGDEILLPPQGRPPTPSGAHWTLLPDIYDVPNLSLIHI